MFCACLFGVLFLFGVLLINGQCHCLVFYLATYLGMSCFWSYLFVQTYWCASWCFINMTILFGVFEIFGKLLGEGVFGRSNQPYHHHHYSEHDIPIWCYCNIPLKNSRSTIY